MDREKLQRWHQDWLDLIGMTEQEYQFYLDKRIPKEYPNFGITSIPFDPEPLNLGVSPLEALIPLMGLPYAGYSGVDDSCR